MRHHSVRGRNVLTASIAAAVLALMTSAEAQRPVSPSVQTSKVKSMKTTETQTHPYVGMWVTKDGHIRHELLANGRYDEARGKVKSAYRGRYRMSGDHIDYVDDTGFTADGDFRGGILYHAGMVLYRER
jgi:hypothetical protein